MCYFSSSTTKTGPHDIAEILLKVALKHQNKNKYYLIHYYIYQQYNILFNKLSTDHGQATGKLYHLRLRVECTLFSSPDPKGHVRYCHHLASVVRPLTFSNILFNKLSDIQNFHYLEIKNKPQMLLVHKNST
jgi:hypothetical protein